MYFLKNLSHVGINSIIMADRAWTRIAKNEGKVVAMKERATVAYCRQTYRNKHLQLCAWPHMWRSTILSALPTFKCAAQTPRNSKHSTVVSVLRQTRLGAPPSAATFLCRNARASRRRWVCFACRNILVTILNLGQFRARAPSPMFPAIFPHQGGTWSVLYGS